MNTSKFTRTIENFICDNCKEEILGNGYTNHCPNCLWSKHVDRNPGDRLSNCLGMMQPIGLRKKAGQLAIIHKCLSCNMLKPNKVSLNDERSRLWELPTLA